MLQETLLSWSCSPCLLVQGLPSALLVKQKCIWYKAIRCEKHRDWNSCGKRNKETPSLSTCDPVDTCESHVLWVMGDLCCHPKFHPSTVATNMDLPQHQNPPVLNGHFLDHTHGDTEISDPIRYLEDLWAPKLTEHVRFQC